MNYTMKVTIPKMEIGCNSTILLPPPCKYVVRVGFPMSNKASIYQGFSTLVNARDWAKYLNAVSNQPIYCEFYKNWNGEDGTPIKANGHLA